MSSNIIKLNVGGKRFATTRSTINSCGDNFLTLLTDEAQKVPVQLDEKGYIFVDRNGEDLLLFLNI